MLTKKEILSYYLEKEGILIMVNHKADGLVLPEYLFGMKNFLSLLLDSKNHISLNDDCLETIKSFKGEEMAIKFHIVQSIWFVMKVIYSRITRSHFLKTSQSTLKIIF